jgi:hypothetical protein
MDILNIIIAIALTGVFFLVLSLIIREVIEIFKIKHNTFQKSSEIAGIISLLALLQFLLSSIDVFVYLISFAMIIIMFVLIKRFYGLTYKKSIIILFCVLLLFFILVILITYILLMLS